MTSQGIKMFLILLLTAVMALIVISIVITLSISAATTTGIGSFAGTAALLGLVPLGGTILLVWFVYNKMRN